MFIKNHRDWPKSNNGQKLSKQVNRTQNKLIVVIQSLMKNMFI